ERDLDTERGRGPHRRVETYPPHEADGRIVDENVPEPVRTPGLADSYRSRRVRFRRDRLGQVLRIPFAELDPRVKFGRLGVGEVRRLATPHHERRDPQLTDPKSAEFHSW